MNKQTALEAVYSLEQVTGAHIIKLEATAACACFGTAGTGAA